MQRLKTKHLYRERKIHDASLLNFSSNDYLNLSSHPLVKKAFIEGVEKYGLGSTSSPQLCGYTSAHQALEEAFADFLGREKAILFNSGYHANLGAITSLTNRLSTIFSDKLCHASLIDAILLSRAKHFRYRHNDITQLNLLLEKTTASHATPESQVQRLIVSESIFSMEGDIADIKSLTSLAKSHQSYLLIDDAHGFGVLGKRGRGIIEQDDLNHEIDCLITPLGKALGSLGAIVSGSNTLIETILQSARTYRYSTAIPAANCVGTLAALTLLKTENWRREKLLCLSNFFNQEATKRELQLTSYDATPIKSILIGNNESVIQLQQKLLKKNILIAAIRPPTVPENTARIRVSLNSEHEEKDVLNLLDHLRDAS